MKEDSLNTPIAAPKPVQEPSFEDMRTLLSARPVVPLEKIETKERHRRHWLLGGAFALAMLLGAASALLASYLKLRNVPTVASEISEVETPAAPVAAVAEPAEGELPVTEDPVETINIEEQAATHVTPKRAPVVRRALTVNPNTDVRPRNVREMGDEEDELDRIRQAILIDEWQERRARRAARRERRNRVDHHDRDLSNLDEIFEGQRRRRP